ncbi:MAG: hypothetical protein J6Z01_14530 [Bacteroidales bacterium]|nr:hypothetical protein [Bacteroidales bacterium]
MCIINSNKIPFEEMSSNSIKIYKVFNFEIIDYPQIQKTYVPRHKKYSYNSYSYSVKKDKIADNFIEIFKIKEQDTFKNKFNEVCSGNGNEVKKITTIHSSSLCGLMFFYNVNNKPITLEINNKQILFDKVLFEFQNKCIKGGKPSNVDIVLESKDKDTILFLESKFAEYILDASKTSTPISNSYKDKDKCPIGAKIYSEDNMKQIFGSNSSILPSTDNKFQIKTENNCYIDGIKQMISHYIGLDNFVKGNLIDKRLYKDFKKIYLGTILFDKFDENTNFEEYQKIYKQLHTIINTVNEQPKITFLQEPIKYSDFVKNNYQHINHTIANFYGLNNI